MSMHIQAHIIYSGILPNNNVFACHGTDLLPEICCVGGYIWSSLFILLLSISSCNLVMTHDNVIVNSNRLHFRCKLL